MKSIWFITNIPTPYRVHFFRALNAELVKRELRLQVSFMALTESGRNWRFCRGEELGFPYAVHSGVHPRLAGVNIHLNAGILARAAFCRVDVTIIGGSWLIPSTALVPLLRKKGICLYWSESNIDSSRYKGKATSLARQFVLSRFDGFCVPNQRALDWVRTYCPAVEEKLVIRLPNLVDEALYRGEVETRRQMKEELRNKNGLRRDDRVLLCPIRLLERKGLGAFLNALKDCKFREVTILVAGNGPERAQLEALSRHMRSVRTRFLGYCNEEKMLELYALADILLLPSFQDPNPLCVIEACHAGLPLLISSFVGNRAEALNEGINGWSFNPFEPFSIVKATESALATPSDQLEVMGNASSEIAKENFSTTKTVNHLIDCLQSISINS